MAAWVRTVHGNLVNLDQMRTVVVKQAADHDRSGGAHWQAGAWHVRARSSSDSHGYVLSVHETRDQAVAAADTIYARLCHLGERAEVQA
jgi:hypothetical protein